MRCAGVRPSNQLSAYTSQHIPGVTLTTCNFDSNYDSAIWSGSRRIGSPRCWPQDSSDHSDQSGHRDSDHSVHSEHRDSGKVFSPSFITMIKLLRDREGIDTVVILLQNRAVPAAVTAIVRTAFTPIAIIEKPKPVSALISWSWHFVLHCWHVSEVVLRLDRILSAMILDRTFLWRYSGYTAVSQEQLVDRLLRLGTQSVRFGKCGWRGK